MDLVSLINTQVSVKQPSVENPEPLSELIPEPADAEDELEKDSGSKVSNQHVKSALEKEKVWFRPVL